jgi:hypothetical protein
MKIYDLQDGEEKSEGLTEMESKKKKISDFLANPGTKKE